MPSTLEIIGYLHQEFFPARESLSVGTSEKAHSGRGFQRYFQAFGEGFNQRVGLSPDAEMIADLSARVRTADDRRMLLESLRVRVAQVLDPLSSAYVRYVHKQHGSDPTFERFSQSFHDRLTGLHDIEFYEEMAVRSPEQVERDRRQEIQERSLSFGCSNVAYVTFSQLELLPRVFHAEQGRLPERDEFNVMAASLARLIHILSSTHHEIHSALMGVLRGPGWRLCQDKEFFWPPYQPEAFRLDDLRLELHPDILEPARSLLKRQAGQSDGKLALRAEEPRIGCPASKIIQTVHEWCMHVAEPVFFQQMETLMRLPHDLSLTRSTQDIEASASIIGAPSDSATQTA